MGGGYGSHGLIFTNAHRGKVLNEARDEAFGAVTVEVSSRIPAEGRIVFMMKDLQGADQMEGAREPMVCEGMEQRRRWQEIRAQVRQDTERTALQRAWEIFFGSPRE